VQGQTIARPTTASWNAAELAEPGLLNEIRLDGSHFTVELRDGQDGRKQTPVPKGITEALPRQLPPGYSVMHPGDIDEPGAGTEALSAEARHLVYGPIPGASKRTQRVLGLLAR
jgi:hypothetical protein